MSEKKCRPTPCNIFFQDQEFMNIENFYALKKFEWEAHREHEAAIKIQKVFRSWLIQKNMKLLNDAATKIQSLIRKFLARIRVDNLREELEKKNLDDERNKAAIKIQRYWRGYYSRKNCFDYHKFKHIQGKNIELTRSIEAINELESLATSSTSFNRSRNEIKQIIEKLCNSKDVHENILKLSPSRICELLDYIEKIHEDCLKKGGRPSPNSLKLVQQLQQKCNRSTRKKKDSLDHLFPELPDIEGIIKPDKEKAERLKEAIRKLRNKIEADDENVLAKQHHLLRTFQQPGVLSDICTHELTPMERKLKSVKFYKGPNLSKYNPNPLQEQEIINENEKILNFFKVKKNRGETMIV